MNNMRWLLLLIPSFLIEIFCYLTVPVVCLFVKQEIVTDTVKRRGKRKVSLMRNNLIDIFKLWGTHDNAVDEWWYGMYNDNSIFQFARKWTQSDYDNSILIRYFCRVMWLWRNCAYGFLYTYFSAPIEKGKVYEKGTEKSWWYKLQVFPSSFQLELNIPLVKWYYSMNIGYKAHKEMPRKMYANRIISFRTIR